MTCKLLSVSWGLADLCNWEVLLLSQVGKAVTMFTDTLTSKQCIQKTFKVFLQEANLKQFLSLA